jgi:hypothetical protein
MWKAYVVGALLVGCSTEVTSQKEGMVATAATSSNDVRFAFAGESKQERLAEVLGGQTPRDFHWLMFSIDRAHLDEMASPQGLSIDLSNPSKFSFSQVYEGTCNPALRNFNACWLYENLVAGSPGVRGTIDLRLSESEITGSFDVTIEGDTDRFGEPIQWHSHQTLGGIFARTPSGFEP